MDFWIDCSLPAGCSPTKKNECNYVLWTDGEKAQGIGKSKSKSFFFDTKDLVKKKVTKNLYDKLQFWLPYIT